MAAANRSGTVIDKQVSRQGLCLRHKLATAVEIAAPSAHRRKRQPQEIPDVYGRAYVGSEKILSSYFAPGR